MSAYPTHKVSVRNHVQTGMAVGVVLFLLWGFLNALLVMGGGVHISLYHHFVQGTPVPPGVKLNLWNSTPIFAISAISHAGMGLLLGGLWGLLIGGYLRIRSKAPETLTDSVSLHASSLISFPLFLLAVLVAILIRDNLGKKVDPVTVWQVVFYLVLITATSFVLFKTSKWLLGILLRLPFVRFGVTKKGFWILTGIYCIGVSLLSFFPPALVSRPIDTESVATLSQDKEVSDPPNILLVVLDTTRSDHLSCYGYPKPTTPNLDLLASEGVLFENAYSPSVWTLPGHASIFTGMVPSRCGVSGEHLYLDESFTTLAEMLERRGYRTAGFCNNPWLSELTGMEQGFQKYRKMWMTPYGTNFLLAHILFRRIEAIFSEIRPPGDFLRHGGVVNTVREALSWIREDPEKPFFVFLNFMEPHPPLDYRSAYTTAFLPEGLTPDEVKEVNQNPYLIWAGHQEMSEEDFAGYAALYDGELRYLDFHVGRFFDQLRSEGILEETFVIITADHGEQIGEGGYLSHRFSVREVLIRVPLILRYPKGLPKGVRSSTMVQTLDILPTLLVTLGIRDPELWAPLQGRTLYPLPREDKRGMVAEELRPLLEMEFLKAFRPHFDVEARYGHRTTAWVHPPFKYVTRDNGVEELYDLSHDNNEIHNSAHVFPMVVKELKTDLHQWLDTFEPYSMEETDYTFLPDPATRKQLRSLGYIQ